MSDFSILNLSKFVFNKPQQIIYILNYGFSVIDTCERYWNECEQKGIRKEKTLERLNEDVERKTLKQRKPSKEIENGVSLKCSPVRRKHERETSTEMFKRRKTNDVTDCGVDLSICKTG